MSITKDADASQDTESLLLSRLSGDFLSCPMCRRRYREPRLLACLHAVCRPCLEALRDATQARQRRFRLSFVSVECPACLRLTEPGLGLGLGRLDKQRLTDSCSSVGSVGSGDSNGTSVEVSSLGCDSVAAEERSFFTYDNGTLRSSVCRSLTTDTLVAGATANAECQTDFFEVVNLGFALFCLHCSDGGAEAATIEAAEDVGADRDWFLQSRQAALSLSGAPDEADRLCGFFDPAADALLARPLCDCEPRTLLRASLCTVQTVLQAATPAQPTGEPVKRAPAAAAAAPTEPFEVRVCSVMFASMESNALDDALLDAFRPTQLMDAACQTTRESPVKVSGAATQTPHLPTRRDCVATGAQTSTLALFSRDAQASPDTVERWSQTVRARDHQRRFDKATQWESAGWVDGQTSGHRLYRSGRVVQVVGAASSSASLADAAPASSSVCERLALSPRSPRRRLGESPLPPPPPPLHKLTESLSTRPKAASASAAGPSGGVPQRGVKFAKPPPNKPAEEEATSSLDKLKNFCARLRQRRSGLAKQKIVLLVEK